MSIYSWTQPICSDCYDVRYPDRVPVQILDYKTEECVDCGFYTDEGIYFRIDPKEARFPSLTKED